MVDGGGYAGLRGLHQELSADLDPETGGLRPPPVRVSVDDAAAAAASCNGKSGLFNVFYRLLARLLIHALLVNSLINPLVLANSRTRLPIPTKILLAVSTASE